MCIKKTIEQAMGSKSISKSELLITIKSLTTHEKGINEVCKLLQSVKRLKSLNLDQDKLALVIQATLESFTTTGQYEEMKDCLEDIGPEVSNCFKRFVGCSQYFRRLTLLLRNLWMR